MRRVSRVRGLFLSKYRLKEIPMHKKQRKIKKSRKKNEQMSSCIPNRYDDRTCGLNSIRKRRRLIKKKDKRAVNFSLVDSTTSTDPRNREFCKNYIYFPSVRNWRILFWLHLLKYRLYLPSNLLFTFAKKKKESKRNITDFLDSGGKLPSTRRASP